jgi:hypothetical protein
MKAYEHERAHSYEHSHHVFDFKSASLFQSLTTAATIGILVGLVGVALNAVWFYRQTSWHVTATVQGLVQMLIASVLVTVVLEQRRKRAIRRTLELAFLNHHVRNALTPDEYDFVHRRSREAGKPPAGCGRPHFGSLVPSRKQRGSDRAVSRS